MALDNTITVSGNVTRDPELRYTPSGRAVANLAVAVNRRWTTQTGETEEAVTFIDITAWGDLGQNVAESVHKGHRILIRGRLDQQSWETPEGDNRNKHVLTAEDIAPSLKWAKTTITKTIRETPTNNGTNPNQPTTPAAVASDEEPF